AEDRHRAREIAERVESFDNLARDPQCAPRVAAPKIRRDVRRVEELLILGNQRLGSRSASSTLDHWPAEELAPSRVAPPHAMALLGAGTRGRDRFLLDPRQVAAIEDLRLVDASSPTGGSFR